MGGRREVPVGTLGFLRVSFKSFCSRDIVLFCPGCSHFVLPLSRSWVDSTRRAWCMLRTQSADNRGRFSVVLIPSHPYLVPSRSRPISAAHCYFVDH
jgi:hypothetical protein